MIAAATSSPDPVIAWNVVLAMLVLATLAVAIVNLIRGGRPQKREVNFAFEPASKTEFDSHVAHNSRIHDLLFEKIEEVNRGATEELKRVRERISGVETASQITNQRLVQVDMKLDRLIERHTTHDS